MYKRLSLNVLDLSNSEKLTSFPSACWEGHDDGYLLRVIVKGTKVDLSKHERWGKTMTSSATKLVFATGAIGAALSTWIAFLGGYDGEVAALAASKGALCGLIGGLALAHNSLPDGGSKTVIQLIKQ